MTTFQEVEKIYNNWVTPAYLRAFSAASEANRALLKKHSLFVKGMYEAAMDEDDGAEFPSDQVDPLIRKAIRSLMDCINTHDQPYFNYVVHYGEVLGARRGSVPPRFIPLWKDYIDKDHTPELDYQWTLDGQRIAHKTGSTWSNRRPFNLLYGTKQTGSGSKYPGLMLPGDRCLVMPGRYQGTHRFALSSRTGQSMVWFESSNPGQVILEKTDTGGSDATYEEHAHSLGFKGIVFAKGTRAALKSESAKNNINTDIVHIDCALRGDYDAETGKGRTGGQWLYHGYNDGSTALGQDWGWVWDGQIDGITNGHNHDEQAFYFHGVGAPGVLIKDFGVFKWCGRSFVKDAFRPGEAVLNGGTIWIEKGVVEDCAIGDGSGGGSHLDFSGTAGLIHVEDVTFLIGENRNLDNRHHKAITGMFVADTYAGAAGCDIEFENVRCQRGHALRSNRSNFKLMKPGTAGNVSIMNCSWVDAPNQPFLFEISTKAAQNWQLMGGQQMVGDCKVDGKIFRDDGTGKAYQQMLVELKARIPDKVQVL